MLMWSQVMVPRLDMTLSDLQDLATRQQQQIDSQQQLLDSKVTIHITRQSVMRAGSGVSRPQVNRHHLLAGAASALPEDAGAAAASAAAGSV